MVANVFHRFEAELAYPGQIVGCNCEPVTPPSHYNSQIEVREGFLQHPLSVEVSLKRRGML